MARVRHRRARWAGRCAAGALAIATLALTGTAHAAPVQRTGSLDGGSLALCGNPGPAATGVQHVIMVMLENQSYNQVVGSPNAPFQTSLASQCGVAPDYFGATHTSSANYLALSAGEYPPASPPGCTGVAKCADASDNLYNELTAAGLTWNAFEESMPSACDPDSSGVNGTQFLYKNGHNPAIFYTDLPASVCQAYDVGVPSLTAESGAFWNDLQNLTLPSFSFVSPDTADDDDGPASAQSEQAADTWLQNFIGLVQQSSSYQAGNTLVLVAYDEGNGADKKTGENCTNESLDLPVVNGVSAHQDSCHVPLFVVYPYTPAGDSDPAFFDHYSITKTVDDLFGLPYLANAGAAQTSSLIGHFGIPSTVTSTPTPAVTILQPASSGTVSGSVTVSGTAGDSAGITQVQLSVDGGTPQTLSGTTYWSTPIDTTTLANGPHTVTVQATDAAGNTGSASITIDVQNSATACPAPAAGVTELSGNVSVESGQAGWTGTYNSKSSVTRVEPSGGSYDGSWALQVAPKAGDSGAAGVDNAKPAWVPGPPGTATTAGQKYTGSVFVKAGTAGEKVSLLVSEVTPSGSAVGSHTSTVTLNGTGWHRITSAYTAQTTGDVLRYRLYAHNLASSSQNFLADCLSLQTP